MIFKTNWDKEYKNFIELYEQYHELLKEVNSDKFMESDISNAKIAEKLANEKIELFKEINEVQGKLSEAAHFSLETFRASFTYYFQTYEFTLGLLEIKNSMEKKDGKKSK